eukprot:SAG22_NODE_465_length_10181_cov_6.604444_7_plen_103_part_00
MKREDKCCLTGHPGLRRLADRHVVLGRQQGVADKQLLIATVGCESSGTARKGRETEGQAVITAFKREDSCPSPAAPAAPRSRYSRPWRQPRARHSGCRGRAS